jgi:hypothetical protein
MDLERANSFGDYQTSHYEEFNDDDGIIDEERVNWPILLARIFSFFLLFCIFVFVALGGLDLEFLVLAAIVAGFLILVVVATYRDPRLWCQKEPKNDLHRVRATVVRPPNIVTRATNPQPVTTTPAPPNSFTSNPMHISSNTARK